jgi:hypothetical protein
MAPAIKAALDHHARFIAERSKSVFNELEAYPQLTNEGFESILAFSIGVFFLEQSKRKSASVIGEKTPDNVRHFFDSDVLFPNAKFIHVVRDGRDCAVSGWFHNLRSSPEWAKQYGPLDNYAVNVADIWAADLTRAQAFADQRAGRILQLRFEDLVADIEGTLDGVFKFLGVDTGETIIDHCRAQASFATLSGGRLPGQENRQSFFRNGMPGDWRNHLKRQGRGGI